MLEMVISGGQTGADQAGLVAAAKFGIATGGYAPRGWRTLAGPAPWLGERFNLVEFSTSNYGERTDANVGFGDATIRIAKDFTSPGERRTISAVKRDGKPSLDIFMHAYQVNELVQFLEENSVRVLNVAGNSEQTAPGIYVWSVQFLMGVFGKVVARGV